jgi:hypothetical protein
VVCRMVMDGIGNGWYRTQLSQHRSASFASLSPVSNKPMQMQCKRPRHRLRLSGLDHILSLLFFNTLPLCAV